MIYRYCLGLLALVVMSCGSGKMVEQEVNINPDRSTAADTMEVPTGITFEDEELEALFGHYLEVQQALASADPAAASQTSKAMGTTTSNSAQLKEYAMKLSETDSLPMQQELFAELTHELGPMLYDGLTYGRIFKYYCPTSSGTGGGYWYTDEQQARNPYAGEEGSDCGTIYEIIRPKSTR